MHPVHNTKVLHGVRACAVPAALEYVLQITLAEQANPLRPHLPCLTLLELSDHLLPLGVRGRTDRFFGFFDCPAEYVDLSVEPLAWLNIVPHPTCRKGCRNRCSGDLPIEYWIGPRFPLQPFEIYGLFLAKLNLPFHGSPAIPPAWRHLCCAHREPAASPLPPPAPTFSAATVAAPLDAGEPVSSTAWLRTEMQALPDPAHYEHLYDSWMGNYYLEHDRYPRDAARHFKSTAERILQDLRRHPAPRSVPVPSPQP